MLARLVGGIHGGLLRGKGGALARSAETQRSRALPGEHVALRVGDGHDGVVERCLNIHDAKGNALALAALELLPLAFLLRRAGGACLCFCHCQFSVLSCRFPGTAARSWELIVSEFPGPDQFPREPANWGQLKSSPLISSSARSCLCAGPCGYARWCGCAGRGPAGCGGDENRGTSRFRSAALYA